MTPGQARIAFLGFAFVLAGVAVNALFFQARTPPVSRPAVERPPARTPADRPRKASAAAHTEPIRPQAPGPAAGEHTLRIARFAPDRARFHTPLQHVDAGAAPKTVGAIRRELAARGYGPLPEDGTLDLATRAAIIAFEHDHGLPPTGEASERLLEHILFGGAKRAEAGAEGGVRSAQAEEVVRTVQQRLAALGYPVGRIDGRLGDETIKAIRDFEMDKGLVPKGRVSADLVARLRDAAEPKSPRR